jgi:hypothetical protein
MPKINWGEFLDDVQKDADRYNFDFSRFHGVSEGARVSFRGDIPNNRYRITLSFDGEEEGESPDRFQYIITISRIRKDGTENILYTDNPLTTEFALRMYYGSLDKLGRRR